MHFEIWSPQSKIHSCLKPGEQKHELFIWLNESFLGVQMFQNIKRVKFLIKTVFIWRSGYVLVLCFKRVRLCLVNIVQQSLFHLAGLFLFSTCEIKKISVMVKPSTLKVTMYKHEHKPYSQQCVYLTVFNKLIFVLLLSVFILLLLIVWFTKEWLTVLLTA